MSFTGMIVVRGWHWSAEQALELAAAGVRTRIDPIVARNGRWLDGEGSWTRIVVCRVRANLNTLGEEPRWPGGEIQALTSLPPEGHGPVAVNVVYVSL